MRAADALAGRSAEVARGPLVTLASDPDGRVRAAALAALASMPPSEPIRHAIDVALEVDDLAIRGSAAQARGALGGPRVIDALLEAAADSAAFELTEVRAICVRALDGLGEAVPESVFDRFVRDPEPMVRRAAAEAIVGRGGRPPRLERIQASTPTRDAGRLVRERFPRVRFTTDRGDFVIEPFEEAPIHARGLVERAASGFYDGLPFHRVVPNFVVQGGDPREDGWGGLDRFVRDQWSRRGFDAFTVAMPTAGKDTGGCQIFVTHLPTPHLDGRYTAFGRVIDGFDVVMAIEQGDRIRGTDVLPPMATAASRADGRRS